MVLNLKQLGGGASHGEKSLDFSCDADLSAVCLWGGFPFKDPVLVTGRVVLRSGIYTLSYTAAFKMTGECARCLSPVANNISAEYEHTVLFKTRDGEIDDNFILAPGGELDLDLLVASDILLQFSGVMICRDDCAGLCQRCGKNLNNGDCGCGPDLPVSRFDALKEFIQ